MNDNLLIGIGDLHGHLPALKRLSDALREEHNIFSDGNRLRDGIEIVFMGDYVDRGAYSKETVAHIMELQKANPQQVRTLMGNHELLALAGSIEARGAIRFSIPEEIYRTLTPHGQNGGWTFVRQYGDDARSAYAGFAAALAPDAPVGAWLRSLLPFHRARIGEREVLFVHGGVPRSLEGTTDWSAYADEFRKHFQADDAPESMKRYLSHPLVDKQSIFWDRRIPNGEVAPDGLVRGANVDAIVIGHTPQDRIRRYGKAIYNIDVGMCPSYGENGPAAILFTPEETITFDLQHGTKTMCG